MLGAVPPLLLLRRRQWIAVTIWAAAAAPLISIAILAAVPNIEYRGASALVVGLWILAPLINDDPCSRRLAPWLPVCMALAELILVVTATVGFRHSSIETAEEVIGSLAPRVNFEVRYARDEAAIAEAFRHLDDFKVVMFVNTTGNLDVEGREKLLGWIRGGGSFIGAHSASDTWHEWPEYVAMLGGEFDFHPDQTTGTLFVEARNHAATATLDSPFALFEEFYRFRNFDGNRVELLLTLRDGSAVLPMAWFKSYGSGRVFYTALGHREDVWTSAWFQRHLSGAIGWALRRDQLPRRRAVRSAP